MTAAPKPLRLVDVSEGSTADRIGNTLRGWILEGRLQPGAALPQDELAAQLKVSKIPLREALVRLKAEGLVDFVPNRGAIVSPYDESEIAEVFTLRMELEAFALGCAVPHLGETDFINAETALALMDAGSSPAQWSSLNWDFHATLYQAAGMPRLLEILRNLHLASTRYLILYLASLNFQSVSQQEHRELLLLVRRRDTEAAVSLLRQHVRGARDHLMQFRRNQS